MKKIVCTVLSFVMIFTVSVSALALKFPDMEDASVAWAKPTVESLSDLGIIKGYTDGTYKPSNQVTNQEAFTLFARSLGVNAKAYQQDVKAAQEAYASISGAYNTYASRELCFMLYRNVITASDIDEYLSEARKNLPMKRYEAAKLITKIMNGEAQANATVMFSFDYNDVNEFPIGSEKYIDFVTKNNIMSGMGDNTFSPNSNVTRAQIAIMLERVMGHLKLDYTPADPQDEKPDDPSKYTTLSVAYNGSSTDESGMQISVYDYNLGIASAARYTLAPTVEITRNGTACSISDLAIADWLTLTLNSENKVIKIDAVNKSRKIENVTYSKSVQTADGISIVLKSENPEFDGFSIAVDANAFIIRNGESASVSSLRAGDALEITSSYGVATIIHATGELTTAPSAEDAKGTIGSISISSEGTYIVLNGRENRIYITDNTKITLDSNGASIYDLRIGQWAEVKLTGNYASEIIASSKHDDNTVTGKVTLVNPSLRFVNLDVSGKTYQVFITDDTAVSSSDGNSGLGIEYIAAGDTLTVSLIQSAGAYQAKTVVIQK